MPLGSRRVSSQSEINTSRWARGAGLGHYSHRTLRPVEVVLLMRHRDALAGRTLELGCGAGRLTGYLPAAGGRVEAIDVSPVMVARCRERYPAVRAEVGDLRRLGGFADASYDAVVAAWNIVDVLDERERETLLGDVQRMLVAGGLLLFSSHNLHFAPRIPGPLRRLWPPHPRTVVRDGPRLPRALRNRRRLRALERPGEEVAVLNDEANDYEALHLYITPAAQRSQLARHGFETLAVLDLEGRELAAGDTAPETSELHYVARRT